MLRYIDSFGHYSWIESNVNILSKWDQTSDFVYQTTGRNGGQAISFYGPRATGCFCTKQFPDQQAHWIAGAAFRFDQSFWTPAVGSHRLLTFGHLGVAQVSLSINSSGQLIVTTGGNIDGTGGATVLATADLPLVLQHWVYLEFQAVIDAAAGSYKVRLNHDTVPGLPDATGVNTQPNAGATADQFTIGSHVGDLTPPNVSACDLYVADAEAGDVTDFIGDIRVQYLLPNAAGVDSQWTPNVHPTNYQNVNSPLDGDGPIPSYPQGISDGTLGFNATDPTAGSGHDFTDTFHYPEPLGDVGRIWGVQALRFMRKDDATSRQSNAIHVCNTAVSDDFGPSEELLESYHYFLYLKERDPGTGAVWTPAEILNDEWGYQSHNP